MINMRYKPMLAYPSKPFSNEEWIFEAKWDGARAISYVYNNAVRIDSRSGVDISIKFPELAKALLEVTESIVLDGEIVLIEKGKQDFQGLMRRIHNEDPLTLQLLAEKHPATYVVFDVLEIDGEPVIDLPLEERKAILDSEVEEGSGIIISKYIYEEGEKYFQAARSLGLEGIMAKKLSSRYEPGKRSKNWLKIKDVKTLDVVVLGFKEGKGERKETFGSMEVGLYKDGKLVKLGYVGTGFDKDELELLSKLSPPFVIEVEYQELTKDGKLRMPRFKRLRLDKSPEECRWAKWM